MRQGINPLRDATIDRPLPPDVPVVAVITHLPSLDGYHKDRFEIVKAAVRSAYKSDGHKAFFVIWDNGSCPDLLNWLFSNARADQYFYSKNIGKQNAINALYGMFSGSIVAISDDDILHYPGWLAKQLEILNAYPNAGLVSGCTTRHYTKYNHLYGYKWIVKKKIKSRFIETPIEWDFQHAESIGKTASFGQYIHDHATTVEINYNGTKAVIGGNHCQFVGYADTLRPFLPRTNRYMEPLYPFDRRVDDAHLLRLLTPERMTRHLGNVLTDADREEIERVLNGNLVERV